MRRTRMLQVALWILLGPARAASYECDVSAADTERTTIIETRTVDVEAGMLASVFLPDSDLVARFGCGFQGPEIKKVLILVFNRGSAPPIASTSSEDGVRSANLNYRDGRTYYSIRCTRI